MSGTGAIRWGDISFRQNETTGRRRCGGRRRARSLRPWAAAGPGRATHRHKPRPIGGCREACGAWPRCRWAAAGPAGQRGDAPDRTSATQAPLVWRAPEGPEGTGGLRGAAPNEVRPPRGLRCLAGFVATHPATHSNQAPLVWRAPEGPAAVPVGGGGAWPGFEATRRAKLAARTARGRAAAHRHTQRPGPPARGTPGAASAARTCAERNPYSPRNALIAGISRTACTRPAR